MTHIGEKTTLGPVGGFRGFFRASTFGDFYTQPSVPVKNKCNDDQGSGTDTPYERIIGFVLDGNAGPSTVNRM